MRLNRLKTVKPCSATVPLSHGGILRVEALTILKIRSGLQKSQRPLPDVDALTLDVAEQQSFKASLAADRSGDFLRALAAVSQEPQPASDAARIYLASLPLAVGPRKEADALFPTVSALRALACVP